MNSWMNPSTSKICPLENTPKRIVLVQTDLERWMQLTIVTYWYLKFPTVYHFGLDRVHLKLCNWRGGRYRCCVRKTKRFQVDISFDIGTEEFQELGQMRQRLDWVGCGWLDSMETWYLYMWIQPRGIPIRSHTLQIIASKVFQNSRRTSAHMTSLACINEDIETPTLKAKTWEKGYILDDCWSKRFPARVCFRNLPLLPGGPHACRLSIGSHRWPSRVQLSLPTSHRIGRSHWPLASNSWHPPCKNVVLGVGSGVAAGIVPPKIWEIYDSHSSMFESVFKTCMVAVFGALPVGY